MAGGGTSFAPSLALIALAAVGAHVARLAASMLEPLLDPATARDDDDDDDGPLTLDAYAALLENQLACDENLADNI